MRHKKKMHGPVRCANFPLGMVDKKKPPEVPEDQGHRNAPNIF